MIKDLVGELYLTQISSDIHVDWAVKDDSWVDTSDHLFKFRIKNSDIVRFTEESLAKDFFGIVNKFVIGKLTDKIDGGVYLFFITSEDIEIIGTLFVEHKGSAFITSIKQALITGEYEDYIDDLVYSYTTSNFYAYLDRCTTNTGLLKILLYNLNKYCGREDIVEPKTMPKYLETKYDYTTKGDFELMQLIALVFGGVESEEYILDNVGIPMKHYVGIEENNNSLYLFNKVSFNSVVKELSGIRDIGYVILTYRNLILTLIVIIDGEHQQAVFGIVGIYKNITKMAYLGCYRLDTMDESFTIDINKFVEDIFNT